MEGNAPLPSFTYQAIAPFRSNIKLAPVAVLLLNLNNRQLPLDFHLTQLLQIF